MAGGPLQMSESQSSIQALMTAVWIHNVSFRPGFAAFSLNHSTILSTQAGGSAAMSNHSSARKAFRVSRKQQEASNNPSAPGGGRPSGGKRGQAGKLALLFGVPQDVFFEVRIHLAHTYLNHVINGHGHLSSVRFCHTFHLLTSWAWPEPRRRSGSS